MGAVPVRALVSYLMAAAVPAHEFDRVEYTDVAVVGVEHQAWLLHSVDREQAAVMVRAGVG